MKCLVAAALACGCFAAGCIQPKTWNGDVYDCPRQLLEQVSERLDACKNLSQQKNASEEKSE